MSTSDSLAEEVETADDDEPYSEDFESSAHGRSSKQETLIYSEDFEASQASLQYSDDFESTANTKTPRTLHSHGDIPQSHGMPRFRPTPRPRKSVNTSLTRSYSEDFEPLTGRSVGAGTPTLLDVQTARSGYSVTYTEDWEQYSRTPRAAVRARSMERMKSMELLTERSVEPSTAYSEEFETVTQTAKTPRFGTRYSTDTLYSYTQTFDSDDEFSSEPEEVDSGTETTESLRRQEVSSGETVTVTERTDSDVSYTYTDATTEDESGSRYDDRAAEAARRQFIMQKLSVLLQSSNKSQREVPRQTIVSAPDKHTTTFCRKKVRLLKKKLKEVSPDAIKEKPTVPTPRRQLSEEDTTNVEDAGISSSVINRLRTENALERMKKLANEEIHEPAKCPTCSEQVAAMALRDYARQKKVLVEAKLIEDRIENNQYLYGDAVAMMGEGVAELPRLTDNRRDIFKRLLQPWSTKLWGSKVLREDDDDKANKENTSLSSTDTAQETKPKPSLPCPYLAKFDSENSEESVKDSLFKPRNLGSPLFNDEEDTSKNENPNLTVTNVFDIYSAKLETLGIGEDLSDPISTYRPDRGTFPTGVHWENVRSRLDSCVDTEPCAPIAATEEMVPVGLDVPTDRQQFWKQYFAPLKTCHWFPNGDKI